MDKHRQVVESVARSDGRPSVLIDVHAGLLCCYTPGAGNRISHYLDLAGGRSIGASRASGYDAQLNPEYVLGQDPDIYIGTGSAHMAADGGLAIGGGIDRQTARRSLQDVTSRNRLQHLTAVETGRAFAVSHQLAISALSVVAFECFAKWLHPQAAADLDPDATIRQINERFLPVQLEGTFCVGAE